MSRHSGRGDGPGQAMSRPKLWFERMGMTDRGDETLNDYFRAARQERKNVIRRRKSRTPDQ
jgi:hypothetical protein